MKQKILYVILLVLLASISLANTAAIKIFDSEIKLGMQSKWEQTFKFAEGDTISFEAKVIEGDDISKFELKRWNGNAIITRIAKKEIEESYYNPKKALYTFFLENSAMIQNKTYKLTIYRTTVIDSLVDFDVTFNADTIYDTTFMEVLNATHELASGIGAVAGYDDKIEIQFQMPEDCTGDLCFVVGTREGVNKLWSTAEVAMDAVGVLNLNPLQAILLGVISNIPEMVSSEGYIKYYLVDTDNLLLHRNGQRFNCIKWGDNVNAEIGRVNLREDNPFWKQKNKRYYYFVVINPAVMYPRTINIKATTMKIKQTIVPK